MKFFLISLTILAALFIAVRLLFGSMDELDWYIAKAGKGYPIRVLVGSMLFILSLVETFVSLIVWIINM